MANEYNNILNAIEELISDIHDKITEMAITQEELSDRLKSYGISISQTSISKKMSLKTSTKDGILYKHEFRLSEIYAICDILNIKFDDYLKRKDSILIDVSGKNRLLLDAESDKFKPYLGKYYCYFLSTKKNEKKIINAELNFSKNDKNECLAQLIVSTGENDEIKHYEGKLSIYLDAGNCYCILFGKDSGEICLLIFDYLQINKNKMKYTMAVAATVSAGQPRYPTIHRMFLSYKELSKVQKENFVMPQLFLNRKEVLLEEEKYKKLVADYPEFEKLYKFIDKAVEPKPYYKIDEPLILQKNLYKDESQKYLSISRLRLYSEANSDNKISHSINEILFNLLENDNLDVLI